MLHCVSPSGPTCWISSTLLLVCGLTKGVPRQTVSLHSLTATLQAALIKDNMAHKASMRMHTAMHVCVYWMCHLGHPFLF